MAKRRKSRFEFCDIVIIHDDPDLDGAIKPHQLYMVVRARVAPEWLEFAQAVGIYTPSRLQLMELSLSEEPYETSAWEWQVRLYCHEI